MILSAAELATLWRPVNDARVDRVVARWLPVPAEAFIPPNNPRYLTLGLGEKSDGTWAPIGMDYAELRYILHLSAQMGRGKSEWLKNLFAGLLAAGAGFMALDCKGTDLVNGTLPLIPLEREKDVIILDLGGTAITGEQLNASMNLLSPSFARSLRMQTSTLASTILNVFATIDPRFEQAPGMKQFASFGMLALLEGEPHATLMHLIRFYGDEDYRLRVCGRVRNAQVKDFWERRFPDMKDGEKASLTSFERRLDQLLTFPELAALMVAPGCSIDLRRMMDTGGILLAGIKATEGQIASIAATLLLTQMTLAALSRTNTPQVEDADGRNPYRPDWPVVIDEAQIVFGQNPGMAPVIFSQLRAMRIGTVVVHQNLEQLANIMGVLSGNAQNRLILGAEAIDAGTYASQYGALGLTREDFTQMERFEHQYIKLYGKGALFSSRMPPMVRQIDEPAPPPVFRDWRTVRAPARTADDRKLDDAIARFRERALVDRDDAIARLGMMPDPLYAAYCARTKAHREAQRAFIIDNPGCIPLDPSLPPEQAARKQKEDRIRVLSALGASIPRIETEALQWKLLMAAAQAAEVRKQRESEEKEAKAAARKGGGAKGKTPREATAAAGVADALPEPPMPRTTAPAPAPAPGSRPPSLADLLATRTSPRDDELPEGFGDFS